ncbi:MAG: bifunctional 2-polyprenyl-6-hydroxyphenol methylase/3-demethylubiquinol 3-O-methyltransferase UbiG [Candidatus Eiseniibacteriota bacterium]
MTGPPPKRDVRHLAEPAKYDEASTLDPEFWYRPDMGLQQLERLRFPYFVEGFGPFEGRSVLDVGCGGGILAEDLAAAGARVVAVDPSARTIEVARAHAKSRGLAIDYRVGFAEDLAESGAYDAVFAVDVLEHVADLGRTLDTCARALRPGGHFGFLTHNQTLEAFTEIIWKWEYLGESAKGGHDFHKFITPDDLRRWLAERGLAVRDITGIAWTEPPSLVPQPTVSYLGYAQKSATPARG